MSFGVLLRRWSCLSVAVVGAGCAVGNSSDRTALPDGVGGGGAGATAGHSGGTAGHSGGTAGVAGGEAGGGSGGAGGEAGGGSGGAGGEAGGGSGGSGGAGGNAGGGAGGAGGNAGGGAGGAGGAAGAGGFATCATGAALAQPKIRPVDIIFMVDNSASMKPAVDEVNAGLNDFASLIDQKSLDYKVIMLSLRGKGVVVAAGKNKYGVCIPPPLSADTDCGDGPRFYQSSIDIRSTQPLEQFLGTLGQTKGYSVADAPQAGGDHRGGAPWKDELRPDATKSIVVVTDDNSRLTATQFLSFPGGKNPYNGGYDLPGGILDPAWGGVFASWVFHGIYGWGSATDPGVLCSYPNKTTPPASGAVYTTLIEQSKGARAQICDGAAAWGPFFDAVAQSVADTSQIACDVTLPSPPDGKALDPAKVNVSFSSQGKDTTIFQVDGPAGPVQCKPDGGWYYDDPVSPTKVYLCPASCDAANAVVGAGKPGSIQVTFGCNSVKP